MRQNDEEDAAGARSSVSMEQPSPAAARARRAARRYSRSALATVALLVMVGIAAGWWITHPGAFADYGPAAVETGSVRAGEVVLVDGVLAPDGIVELRRVEPQLAAGSAEVTMFVQVCSEGAAGGVGFVVGQPLEPFCPEPQIVSGTEFGAPGQQLVVTMVPTEPGEIVIDGFEVSYRRGLRFGSQLTGARIEISVLP